MKKIIGIFIAILFIGASLPVVDAMNRLKNETQMEDQFNSLAFDDFDEEINRLMKKGHIPSLTLCYIKDDEIVLSKAYGLSDIKQNKETTIDTTYMVASIT